MLRFLPSPLLGLVAGILHLFNALFWVLLLFLTLIVFLILWPIKPLRDRFQAVIRGFPDYWTSVSRMILNLKPPMQWDVQGVEGLQPNDWYLLIANHQTWADIIVLQLVFSLRIPSLRFFMKKELLWQLPIVAQACWILGYPFVQRYNKDYLKKHPDRKGKDLETTRKICKRFKKTPISLINFSEGGRFNPQRHARQRSPYRYLLKPRAGGIAFILGAMPQMRTLLDVTIIYDKEQASFWDFLSGRLRKITIRVRRIPITDELRGDYTNDVTFRRHFQRRLNQLWQEKDDLIAEIKRGQEKSTL